MNDDMRLRLLRKRANSSTHAERMLSLAERNRELRERLEFGKHDNELDILISHGFRKFASE